MSVCETCYGLWAKTGQPVTRETSQDGRVQRNYDRFNIWIRFNYYENFQLIDKLFLKGKENE